MHLHNALTHAVQLQAAYAAALGEKADAEFSGIERAGETLTPVIDLWALTEWRWLRRVNTLVQTLTVAAGGAGVRSRIGVQNPVGSQLISVVEVVQAVSAATTLSMTLGTGLTADSSSLMRPIDSRFHTPTAASGRTLLTSRAGAIGGVSTALGSMYAGLGVLVPLDVILGPGFALSLDPSADNLAITLHLRVRERTALPGEL